MASEPISSGPLARHLSAHVLPASVLRHTPPPAAPIHTRSALVGSTITDVARPPMLDGPAWTQSLTSVPGANVRDARRRSATRAARDASRIGHVTRLLNHAARFLCFETRGAGLPDLRFLAAISTRGAGGTSAGFRRLDRARAPRCDRDGFFRAMSDLRSAARPSVSRAPYDSVQAPRRTTLRLASVTGRRRTDRRTGRSAMAAATASSTRTLGTGRTGFRWHCIRGSVRSALACAPRASRVDPMFALRRAAHGESSETDPALPPNLLWDRTAPYPLSPSGNRFEHGEARSRAQDLNPRTVSRV